MVLSDREIRAYLYGWEKPIPGKLFQYDWHGLKIDPLDETQIQPASIDMKLAPEFRTYPLPLNPDWIHLYSEEKRAYWERNGPIDLDNRHQAETVLIENEKYELTPGEFILGSTIERVEIPDDLCARVEGKSSLGRLGLLIHATAGYIDPGFKGNITLEIMNLNSRPIILRADKPVCQLSLIKLSSPAERPYGHAELNSHYQGQTGVQESLYEG